MNEVFDLLVLDTNFYTLKRKTGEIFECQITCLCKNKLLNYMHIILSLHHHYILSIRSMLAVLKISDISSSAQEI